MTWLPVVPGPGRILNFAVASRHLKLAAHVDKSMTAWLSLGLPRDAALKAARLVPRPSRFVLSVHVASQRMRLFEHARFIAPKTAALAESCIQVRAVTHRLDRNWAGALREQWRPIPHISGRPAPAYILRSEYVVSTSRYGIGQVEGSNQTPLGLHRVARKVGGGQPIGTVFKSRQPVGYTWRGLPDAAIVHRILWLEGCEPGVNGGGRVDTFRRYIYIHGFADETTLGRPQSHGCIHVAAADLIPLYDLLPVGTLVWIAAR